LTLEAEKVASRLQPSAVEQLVRSGSKQWQIASDGENQRRERAKLWSIGGVALAATGWLLLLIGTVGYVFALFLRRRMPLAARNTRILRSTIVWIAVLAGTFAILGLLPAFEPQLQDFHWNVAAATAGLLVIGAGWCALIVGRYVVRQGRLPAAKRSPLYHVGRLALVIGGSMIFIIALFATVDDKFRASLYDFGRHFPSDIGITKRGVVTHFSYVPEKSLLWAVLQFAAHGGMFIAATLGFLILLLSRSLKSLRASDAPGQQSRRKWIYSVLLDSLQATSLATMFFAVVLFLFSLAATTQWLNCLQGEYDQDRARVADPGWFEKEVVAALDISSAS
jgi:hypothetical protein